MTTHPRVKIAAAALCILTAAAQAETVSINSYQSLPEGGLVAVQALDCPDNGTSTNYTHEYCEYRDTAGSGAAPGEGRMRDVRFRVENAQGGSYTIQWDTTNLQLYRNGTLVSGSSTTAFTLTQGKAGDITFQVAAVPNYAADGNRSASITAYRDSNQIGSRTLTIRDDDGSVYAGQRRAHAYDGQWQRLPYCYAVTDCAFD